MVAADIYDEVWEIISALDMRGIRIKDLEEYGITQSLFYKTLKHLNINSKELTGGSGSKFKFKMKNPLPPEEMKERNAKLLNKVESLTAKPLEDKSVTKNVYLGPALIKSYKPSLRKLKILSKIT
jgi:hypothetical protein